MHISYRLAGVINLKLNYIIYNNNKNTFILKFEYGMKRTNIF